MTNGRYHVSRYDLTKRVHHRYIGNEMGAGEREKDRDRETETERQRVTERDRETDRQTDRQTEGART